MSDPVLLGLTTDQIVFAVSGVFAFSSTIITAVQMFLYFRNWNKPVEQRLVIRLLLMCPVYAINAWLAIVLKEQAVYLNTLRACYESFVIYSFFSYLITICGGAEELADFLTKLPVQVLSCVLYFGAHICAETHNPDLLYYLSAWSV